MTDADTTAAIEALAHRIRTRDAEADRADAEVFALEFMTALRGRGWRPTEAKPLPAWNRSPGSGSKPPADVLRELRTDLDAKAAAFRHPEGGAA